MGSYVSCTYLRHDPVSTRMVKRTYVDSQGDLDVLVPLLPASMTPSEKSRPAKNVTYSPLGSGSDHSEFIPDTVLHECVSLPSK